MNSFNFEGLSIATQMFNNKGSILQKQKKDNIFLFLDGVLFTDKII